MHIKYLWFVSFFVKILFVSLLSFVNILSGIIKHFMLPLKHLSKNLFHVMLFHILLTSTFKLQFHWKLWFPVVSQVQYITSMNGLYKLHLPNIIWKEEYCVDFCLEVRIANSAAGNNSSQSSWLSLTLFNKMFLRVWFNRSQRPLLCGWYAEVTWWSVPDSFINSAFNLQTNSLPWSEITILAQPNLYINTSKVIEIQFSDHSQL